MYKTFALIMLSLVPFTCISMGCGRTVSDQKTEQKRTDGSTEKHETKVTEDHDGQVTKTQQDTVENHK